MVIIRKSKRLKFELTKAQNILEKVIDEIKPSCGKNELIIAETLIQQVINELKR